MKRRMWIGALAAAAVAAVLGLGLRPGGADCRVPSFTYKHAAVTFSEHGATTEVRVEIADTPEMTEVGLMCRTSLDRDAGMLFMFPDDTRIPFWMKNTLIPLSIAFLDAGWHIVAIMDMRVAPDPSTPPPTDLFAPPKPYRYALEVNQGFFTAHGIDGKADLKPPAPIP